MFSKCTTQINFSLCVVNKLAKVLKTPVYKASVEKCELRAIKNKKPHLAIGWRNNQDEKQ
jgi:hypothetical protein